MPRPAPTRPPRRRAPPGPVSPVVCLGFKLDRLCFYIMSFVGASEETSRTIVFDYLGGKVTGYLLGVPTGRRPTAPCRPRLASPRPTPPRPARRCAPPFPSALRPWRVRVFNGALALAVLPCSLRKLLIIT